MEPTGNPRLPPLTGGSCGGGHHRRAHSETFLRLPDDDFLFDPDVDFSISDLDFPSLSDDSTSAGATAAAVDPSPKLPAPAVHPPTRSHLRSLSLDAGFFDGVSFPGMVGDLGGGGGDGGGVDGGMRPGHRRSGSMDGSSSSTFDGESSGPGSLYFDYAKKAMPAERLAELALHDPKRAKRILANRQSAARSKERKIRYTGELEKKVQTLQTEATTLSAQLTLLQRDTSGLTAENRELKLRLHAMEEQAKLREALNEALQEELKHLRIVAGQITKINGSPFNGDLRVPKASDISRPWQPQQVPSYIGQPHAALNIQPPWSQTAPNGPPRCDQPQKDRMDFI